MSPGGVSSVRARTSRCRTSSPENACWNMFFFVQSWPTERFRTELSNVHLNTMHGQFAIPGGTYWQLKRPGPTSIGNAPCISPLRDWISKCHMHTWQVSAGCFSPALTISTPGIDTWKFNIKTATAGDGTARGFEVMPLTIRRFVSLCRQRGKSTDSLEHAEQVGDIQSVQICLTYLSQPSPACSKPLLGRCSRRLQTRTETTDWQFQDERTPKPKHVADPDSQPKGWLAIA